MQHGARQSDCRHHTERMEWKSYRQRVDLENARSQEEAQKRFASLAQPAAATPPANANAKPNSLDPEIALKMLRLVSDPTLREEIVGRLSVGGGGGG